jgi:4-carboxymuconolactone decarboxylase
MKARIPLPAIEQLSGTARTIYESVLSTRSSLDGPFLAWLHSPGLAGPAEKLGAFCRYHTIFQAVESELLILIVAAHHRCTGEWQIHAPLALKAGVESPAIEMICAGKRPEFASVRLSTLHDFAIELLRNGYVSDTTFGQAQKLFGYQGLVELVGVIGYYSFVAMTLNAFEMKLDDGTEPFKLGKS